MLRGNVENQTDNLVPIVIMEFLSNSSSNEGAIYFISTAANLTHCDFIANTAAHDGGAVYFASGGTIKYDSFRFNKAERGGAIFVKDDIYQRNISLKSNTAKEGIDIFSVDSTNLNLCLTVLNVNKTHNVTVEIKTAGNFSGKMSLEIDNVSYDVNVVRGFAKISLKHLNIGSHKAVASFRDNERFAPCTVSTKFKVSSPEGKPE